MGSRIVVHKTWCFAFVKAHPPPSLFVAFDPCTSHAGAGGARSRAISIRMSLNMSRDTATSASVPGAGTLVLYRLRLQPPSECQCAEQCFDRRGNVKQAWSHWVDRRNWVSATQRFELRVSRELTAAAPGTSKLGNAWSKSSGTGQRLNGRATCPV